MDRKIVYARSGVQDTDIMYLQKWARRAMNYLARSVFGSNGAAVNFYPASYSGLYITFGDGALIGPLVNEDAAQGSLPDEGYSTIPIAFNLNPTTLGPFASPSANNQSINYLVWLQYSTTDTDNKVGYYQSTDPAIVWRGVGNNGNPQPTSRKETVTMGFTAGAQGNTGSQVTPAPTGTQIPLFVVTVGQGATTLNSSNIAQHPNAPWIKSGGPDRGILPGRLIGVRVFNTVGVTNYVPTPGTNSIIYKVQGGGGGAGGTPGSGTGTVQGAAIGGGGAGGYAEGRLTSGFAGLPMTIGAGGVGGAPGNNGMPGGSSSLGAVATALGGGSTISSPLYTTSTAAPGGGGGNATGGNIVNAVGESGLFGLWTTGGSLVSGAGGNTRFGAGGGPVGGGSNGTGSNGNNGNGYGAGGSGASGNTTGNPATPGYMGGNGASGVIMIEEYT